MSKKKTDFHLGSTMGRYSSLQEIFNKGIKGLAKQGFVRAMKHDKNCAYAGENDLSCFIGHCLTSRERKFFDNIDNMEDPENSDTSTGIGCWKQNDREKIFGDIDVSDLESLQNVHDVNEDPNLMKLAYIKVAKDFNLEIPEELRS